MTTASAVKTSIENDGRVRLDAAQLKRLRKQAGHSQESLAQHCQRKRLCISIASIKRAEAGCPVLHRTARHFAECYGIALSSLLLHSVPDLPPALETCHDVSLHSVVRLTIPTGIDRAAAMELIQYQVRLLGGHIEVMN